MPGDDEEDAAADDRFPAPRSSTRSGPAGAQGGRGTVSAAQALLIRRRMRAVMEDGLLRCPRCETLFSGATGATKQIGSRACDTAAGKLDRLVRTRATGTLTQLVPWWFG